MVTVEKNQLYTNVPPQNSKGCLAILQREFSVAGKCPQEIEGLFRILYISQGQVV
jgi:hypothetical protein